MSAFDTLNVLNINEHTEKKNVGDKELTYLSWPWAWAEVKKRYPEAQYTIWRNEKGQPYTFDPETGYMVYTSVTIEGVQHEMWLPVMDGANRAMKAVPYDYTVKNPKFKWAKWDAQKKGYYDRYGNEQPEFLKKHCDAATMMDINKTIMRCLVKNLAMFGLGLYLYAGEDLPEAEQQETEKQEETLPEPVQSANVRPEGNGATTPPVAVESKQMVPPTPSVETPLEYLSNELNFMSQLLGIPDIRQMGLKFIEMRKALILGGVVPDIPKDKLTMEQMKDLVDAIYKNFFADKKDVKTA